MKSIGELRTTLNFTPHEINSQVKYFAEHVNIDFDVFLPTKNMNLQRDFVWTIDQKRELIWSILMKRNIPRMAIMNVVSDISDTDGTYQVIDGKQRLSSMIDFFNNKYTLLIDSKEYLFKELPKDYQNVIQGYHFSYYIANEDYGDLFTDQDKINWFMYINFAGTPQDKLHFDKLSL
jgi:uncharacterized protein with ParB-like and HNH nuclease domain